MIASALHPALQCSTHNRNEASAKCCFLRQSFSRGPPRISRGTGSQAATACSRKTLDPDTCVHTNTRRTHTHNHATFYHTHSHTSHSVPSRRHHCFYRTVASFPARSCLSEVPPQTPAGLSFYSNTGPVSPEPCCSLPRALVAHTLQLVRIRPVRGAALVPSRAPRCKLPALANPPTLTRRIDERAGNTWTAVLIKPVKRRPRWRAHRSSTRACSPPRFGTHKLPYCPTTCSNLCARVDVGPPSLPPSWQISTLCFGLGDRLCINGATVNALGLGP